MVIRHGEKPGANGRPHGVDPEGAHCAESLSPLGWARAGALVSLFDPSAGQTPRAGLTRPATLMASHDHGPKGGSRRQAQTLSLLARQLGVETDLRFGVGEEAAAAAAALDAPGSVLVCWEHKNIPVLGAALGARVPAKWPKDRFDMVWVIDGATCTQIPELLLPGDSAEPIAAVAS